MKKSSSATARIVAVIALVGALLLAIVVISGALGGDSSDSGKHSHGGNGAHHTKQAQRNVPATYTVESGDTLISIAHENGVTVAQIERLNPEVDPQILIAGETLKLR
jgi:LysM repeat protein